MSSLQIGSLILLFLVWSGIIWSRAAYVSRPLTEENQVLGERLTIAARFCDPLPNPVRALLLRLARVVETNPDRLAVINEEGLPHKAYEEMTPGYRLYGLFQRTSHPDTNTTNELRTLASHALMRLNSCLMAFSLIVLLALVSLSLGPRMRKSEPSPLPNWNPIQVLSLYLAWDILSYFAIGRILLVWGGSLSGFERVFLTTILTAAFPVALLIFGSWKATWYPFGRKHWMSSWGWIGPVYGISLVGIPVIESLVEIALGHRLPDSGFVHFLAAQSSPSKIFGLVLIATLIGPFCEEVMFRGFLLDGLVPTIGQSKAVLVSASLFAVGHGGVSHWPSSFFFGWLLGWLYLKSESLWITVAVHAMWNASVLCLLFASIP